MTDTDTMKPYAESCDENKGPILDVLREVLADRRTVLEIGSGTGQHAIYFARRLPHLLWQPSDLPMLHAGILAWMQEADLENVLPPLALEVTGAWPASHYDAVFSANTAHIMSWPQVEAMFAGVGRVLAPGGCFCLYGPFNYRGTYTSTSNARFDTWLQGRDPLSGIRDFEAVDALAAAQDMTLLRDYPMPVNNRTLVWRRNANAGAAPAR